MLRFKLADLAFLEENHNWPASLKAVLKPVLSQ